jgi:putative Holliday junction resolvase
MDGTEGARADLYRAFADLLEAETGLKPVLWDERRTTVEAHAILHAGGKRMKAHKKNVDAVAAALILEGYLAFRKQEQT